MLKTDVHTLNLDNSIFSEDFISLESSFLHYPWQVADKITLAVTKTGACGIYHPELLYF